MLQYTNIQHPARKKLGITTNEYCVCDMVYHLSSNPVAPVKGWCNMSRQNMGIELDLSKQTAINIVNKMVDKNLLRKNKAGNLKTTNLWFKTVVFSGKESLPIPENKEDQIGKESLPGSVKKVYRTGKESLPYNNSNNNKDKEEEKNPSFEDLHDTEFSMDDLLNPFKSNPIKYSSKKKKKVANKKKEQDFNHYQNYLELWGILDNQPLSVIACKIPHDQWPLITDHLPRYLERTSIDGGKKQFRSSAITYLTKCHWVNSPNPTKKTVSTGKKSLYTQPI